MFHEIFPQKLDIAYKPRAARDNDFVVIVREGKIVVLRDKEQISLPLANSFEEKQLQFLFFIDDKAFFLFVGDAQKVSLEKSQEIVIRELRNEKPMWIAYAATLAFRLSEWYKSSCFCGKCGAKNVHSKNERAMVCSKCGFTVYPTIAPSVIVLIKNGNKTLLTKYQSSHSVYRRYALVAGYVESGETPEEAVRREVMEEVGLKVKNICYYKSQPWPLSGALLLGYICELDGDEAINLDYNELSVAEWVLREDMPDRSDDVSLTSELMELFRNGKA